VVVYQPPPKKNILHAAEEIPREQPLVVRRGRNMGPNGCVSIRDPRKLGREEFFEKRVFPPP